MMTTKPTIGIIMGSQSDWPTLKYSADILDEFDVVYETKIVSAHRTPDRLWEYGKSAINRGLNVIIAGAGGSCPFARNDGIKNAHTSNRCPNKNTSFIRSR
jgi:5-(carboxyamino)imidazole ribonucleotide mutase